MIAAAFFFGAAPAGEPAAPAADSESTQGTPRKPNPVKNFGELAAERKSELDALELEYASGKIDEAEYEKRRNAFFKKANPVL